MADIVLTTLNARYAHCSFGLRCLMANLGDLRDRARIVEFEIAQRPVDMLERILAERPRIVGLGVYIWNVEQATQLVADLKLIRPDILVVLGGPEVGYPADRPHIVDLADFVITGEADLAFADLCRRLLDGDRPPAKVIPADPPQFIASSPDRCVALPYDLYTPDDIAHRVIYVEASRGCPFRCEFCLSSLDVPLRNVPLEGFLPSMQALLDRGARHLKFVDRTFNLNANISRAILRFLLDRHQPGMLFHFEMIPDRLPDELRELIVRFPPGALQFEMGIQTFNEEVAARISRRQDNLKVEQNLRWLREQTGVHIHADLIAGLPGEDIASFAAGFDRLVALGPQEIQLGILKRLRGTPIARHTRAWQMVYSPYAPYEILQNGLIDFVAMQRIKRFARYWDLVANSGNFVDTTPLLLGDTSPFAAFMAFSDWLYGQTARTHGIALHVLAQLVFEYLVQRRGFPAELAAGALWRDYQRGGRKDKPDFLRAHLPAEAGGRGAETGAGPGAASRALQRQSRHLR